MENDKETHLDTNAGGKAPPEPSKEEEKLPIDARLLSEAVIELNISRRSVGLYPPGHSFITSAIDRAYDLLQKLFELRRGITLGVAKDHLVIDEYSLDPNNPVYIEVAESFHDKGIAGITFSSGLTRAELTALHELLIMKDAPTGKEFTDLARERGLAHIHLSPIDYDSFRFVEGTRAEGKTAGDIWEDYVYGLMSGKLTSDDVSGAFLKASPEELASILNEAMPKHHGAESYDKVITSYLTGKDKLQMRPDAANKLFKLIDNLNPDIQKQFLARTFDRISGDTTQAQEMLASMSADKLEETINFFNKHASMVPTALRNVMNRLGSIKSDKPFRFDMLMGKTSVVHDIEISEGLTSLFTEDTFKQFVKSDYQKQLETMIRTAAPRIMTEVAELKTDCNEDMVDQIASEVMLEVLDTDIITPKDFLEVLTRLCELSEELVDTGRFEEVLNIYNTIYSHSMTGRYTHEAGSTIAYFFQSEAFITRLVSSLLIWGRKDQEGAVRLARGLKAHLITPLINFLVESDDQASRKFLLDLLSGIGSDVIPEAVSRLTDGRWYVARNMLALIRKAGSPQHMIHVRKLVKHHDIRLAMEAVRTLLHFKTQDAVPYLKYYLNSKNEKVREQAVVLAGHYRITEAVPSLIEIISQKDRLGTTSIMKNYAVKSLGEIGDARAIRPLISLFEAKVIVNRGPMEELKREVFKNLRKYPPSAIRPLVERGLQSHDDFIRTTSESLMKYLSTREQPS